MKYFENDDFEYKIHKKVLTIDECKGLINEFTEFKTARTFNGDLEIDREYRKADIAVYDKESTLLKRIREIISEKTNTNINQQETPVSVIRYNIGGQYKPHYDFYNDLKEIVNPESGNRIKTVIIYLNDDYIGGETEFRLENIKIKGEQGDLLEWKNLNRNRTQNKKTLHAGLPVIEGTKYIVVCWIREFELNREIKKTLL